MARRRIADGPLIFPAPAGPGTLDVIRSKLQGHVTSARWLPEGMWAELDEIRAEHLRVRSQVQRDIDAWHALRASHQAEEAKYATALTEAHRAGIEPPEDCRTPQDQRAAERERIERSMWSGVKVLAEVVDRARAVLVKNEAEWLADLGGSRSEMQEAVREAERALHQARAKAWRGVKLGRWLKAEVENGPFAGQPAPTGDEKMPDGFDPAQHTDAFERRYYEVERIRPIENDDPLALEPDHGEHDDGEVLIAPLDDKVRWSGAKAS